MINKNHANTNYLNIGDVISHDGVTTFDLAMNPLKVILRRFSLFFSSSGRQTSTAAILLDHVDLLPLMAIEGTHEKHFLWCRYSPCATFPLPSFPPLLSIKTLDIDEKDMSVYQNNVLNYA